MLSKITNAVKELFTFKVDDPKREKHYEQLKKVQDARRVETDKERENLRKQITKMGYPAVLSAVSRMAYEVAPVRRETKEYKRQMASYRAHAANTEWNGVYSGPVKPESTADSLRATIICAVLAHTRGKLHFQRVGHWWDYNEKAAASTRQVVPEAVQSGRSTVLRKKEVWIQGDNVYPIPQDETGFEWQKKTIKKHLDWEEKRFYWNYYKPALFSLYELELLYYLLENARAYKG